MSGAVPIRDAARALGVPPITLRHWIAAGAPVARRGGRGRGNCTLVAPAAVRAWRSAGTADQLLHALAAELPQALAEAMAEAHALATGVAKAPLAGILAGVWYITVSKTLDALRAHGATIPEIAAIPATIERLRDIAGR